MVGGGITKNIFIEKRLKLLSNSIQYIISSNWLKFLVKIQKHDKCMLRNSRVSTDHLASNLYKSRVKRAIQTFIPQIFCCLKFFVLFIFCF